MSVHELQSNLLTSQHYVLSNAQVIGSTGLQSSPRFSQLPFWPAGFVTSLLAIENITDIYFPIWTLRVRCAVCFLGISQVDHLNENIMNLSPKDQLSKSLILICV